MEAGGNLLRFSLSVSHSSLRAHTLFDCGASQKFVNKKFMKKLVAEGVTVKVRRRGRMNLTTAGEERSLPCWEARLTLDMAGVPSTGWFVILQLAKYDIILGKDWMEANPHRVDLQANRLFLGDRVLEGLPLGRTTAQEVTMTPASVSLATIEDLQDAEEKVACEESVAGEEKEASAAKEAAKKTEAAEESLVPEPVQEIWRMMGVPEKRMELHHLRRILGRTPPCH
jgi:hypothetical protein